MNGGIPAEIPRPKQTTLELRDYQTSTFETNDLSTITKVIMDVLRDDEFVVGTYDKELGIINASKIVNFDKKEDARNAFQEFGTDLKPKKKISIDFNATVTPFGASTKVRVIFRIGIAPIFCTPCEVLGLRFS